MKINTAHQRRVAVLAVVATASLLLAGCSSPTPVQSGSSGGKAPKDIKVAIVVATSSLNFAQEMVSGAKSAAAEFGVNLQVYAPPTFDAPAEIALFQTAWAQNPDGVALEEIAPDLFAVQTAQAIAAGVPVVAVDTAMPDSSKVTTYVGNDNMAAGGELGGYVCKNLPANAKGGVVLGVDTPGLPLLENRLKGIKSAINTCRSDLAVTGPFNVGNEPAMNLSAWSNVVAANADSSAFLGAGDQDSVSLAVIKTTNNATWLSAAFDLNPKALAAVNSGTNLAIEDPWHFMKGYTAVRLLIEQAMTGKPMVQGWWNSGNALINKDNSAEIIARETGDSSKQAWFKKYQEAQFANPSAQIKPISQAN